jgi:hypothetical protein
MRPNLMKLEKLEVVPIEFMFPKKNWILAKGGSGHFSFTICYKVMKFLAR